MADGSAGAGEDKDDEEDYGKGEEEGRGRIEEGGWNRLVGGQEPPTATDEVVACDDAFDRAQSNADQCRSMGSTGARRTLDQRSVRPIGCAHWLGPWLDPSLQTPSREAHVFPRCAHPTAAGPVERWAGANVRPLTRPGSAPAKAHNTEYISDLATHELRTQPHTQLERAHLIRRRTYTESGVGYLVLYEPTRCDMCRSTSYANRAITSVEQRGFTRIFDFCHHVIIASKVKTFAESSLFQS